MRFPTSSRLPLSVYIDKNQVLNRVVVDVFGWGGPGIIMARNPYEKLERTLDIGLWLIAGIVFPIIFAKVFNGWLGNTLLKKPFNLASKSNPLAIPFEWTDKIAQKKLRDLPETALAQFGFRHANELSPTLLKRIQTLKLWILAVDLLLMASKGQGFFWGKNWLTQKLSGMKGFSGEFGIADKDLLDEKAKTYEQGHKRKLLTSLSVGFGAAIALPLITKFVLNASSGSWLNKLKPFIHLVNYQDAVFMSRFVVLWHTFFNWNMPSVLSARDNHERRENFIRTSLIYLFYAFGDKLISGLLAKRLQKLVSVPIIANHSYAFNLPKMLPLETLYQQYGKASKAYKLGLFNFWVGLVGTCAIINSIIPLLNNYYTRKKVQEEIRLRASSSPSNLQSSSAFNAFQGV